MPLSDTTRATVLETLRFARYTVMYSDIPNDLADRYETAIAEIKSGQEWTPVEDGEYTDGICGVRVRGRLIGISSVPSIASSYYGGELPDNMRLCQRTGSQEARDE